MVAGKYNWCQGLEIIPGQVGHYRPDDKDGSWLKFDNACWPGNNAKAVCTVTFVVGLES